MTSLEIAIAKTALKKMESDGHFSICTIDNILKMSRGVPNSEAYTQLRVLHCVNFKDMPMEVLQALPSLIRKCLETAPLELTSEVHDFVPLTDTLKRLTESKSPLGLNKCLG
jgi:hypothetical protein